MVLKAGGKADRSARAIPEILLGINLYEKINDVKGEFSDVKLL